MNTDIRLLRWPDRDRENHERLVAAISRVRTAAAQGRGEIVASAFVGPEEPDDADRARALLAQRRSRDAAAGPLAELFGEPGWDILLILFVAYEEGRTVTSGPLLAETGVRAAVGRRWLQVMQARGLIRWDGAGARDTTPVALTDEGMVFTLRCIAAA
ncbi:hypothetical protein [Sphingomonas melonis]|jgi:hypothetical protein|uniref:HTH marR-type domain-containing protein n=1 Tax=Sphingomonas melonis TaxID=152682 RepID=A0A7Y9K2C8_9SPHN|nr:hypothetical protein [Sphingomonas melonis]NYD90816.1 hypothetical protein [Sphingomonas melonis]